MINKVLLYLLILLCLVTQSCRDDDDVSPFTLCDEEQRVIDPRCENYDPCLNVQAATANFDLRIGSGTHTQTFFDTTVYINFDDNDTIIPSSYEFYAVEEADEYLWTFPGTNITGTGRSFDLSFSLQNPGYHVPVKLTTKLLDVDDCLTSSERIATSERTFFVGSELWDTIHYGDFIGKHCNVEEDLRTIRISEGDLVYERFMTNFPYECAADTSNGVKLWVFPNGRKFLLVSRERNNNLCGQAVGVGELSVDRQTIRFTYRFTRQDGSYEQRCWEGQRL
jgi:hypothetical protein